MKKRLYNNQFLIRTSLPKILLIFFIVISFAAVAQQNHFIYLQTDNNQPFYANINNQHYSSSGSGYLILPKILQGDYQITVGFAGNQIEEQHFNCTIENNDVGYAIKNFPDKGWGLFNLQTLSITMASSKIEKVEIKPNVFPQEAKEIAIVDSQFVEKEKEIQPNKIAEKKVETPPIQIQQPIKEEKKTEIIQKPIIEEEKKAEITQPIIVKKDEIKKDDKPEEKPKTTISIVNKTAQITSTDGLHLVFQDKLENTIDTIYALIPFANNHNKTEEENTINKAQEADTLKKAKREMYNSTCVSLATDDDFFKLRKKMASQTDDDKMISEARKVYKNKCFDVQQIRNLSTLFLSDNGRFKFFESSISNVYDFVNFSNLEKELNDESMLKLFKNLLN